MSNSPLRRISARDNPEFKRFLAVRARKNRDLILVEGQKLVGEAIRSGLGIEILAVAEAERAATNQFAARSQVVFAPSLMKGLSDVETHQGIMALVERPHFDSSWLLRRDAFLLILDGVQDPGNVGTLLRSGEAAGVSGVLLTRGCADPFSPKALRASAGSAFRMPHLQDLLPDELLSRLPDGLRVVAAVADKEAASIFGDKDLALPLALALGSEGQGLGALIEQAATARIRVPFAASVESLNVAAAGAILMFEIARRAGKLG